MIDIEIEANDPDICVMSRVPVLPKKGDLLSFYDHEWEYGIVEDITFMFSKNGEFERVRIIVQI
jgi:hypothetical protein